MRFTSHAPIPFEQSRLRVGYAMCEEMHSLSNCVRRQVSALLLDEAGIVKSMGFNWLATDEADCSTICPRAKRSLEEVPSLSPYNAPGQECFSTHAEVDCLSRVEGRSVRGWWMLVTNKPCPECQHLLDSVGVNAIWKEEA